METYPDGKTATYTYTYDNGGNLLAETRDGVRHTYAYDTAWKDKLIKYDGKTITYDKMGRPTDYMGKTMTWDSSGNLTAISNTGNGTVRYTYHSDGQRRTKTVNSRTTTYHYNNGILLSEQTGDETLRYYYDAAGKVTTLTYKKGTKAEVSYFYARNLQGDITAIYRNSDSKLIGTYEYDLWGRPVSVTEAAKGIDTDGILTKNPFRYRGYYYDAETGFYHLGARYYDPEIRRFISPDDLIASVGTSVQGHNLYAYCFNNPVNMADPSGHWPQLIKQVIKGTAKNVVKPAINFAQNMLSKVDATYSSGINISATPSFWVFDVTGGIVMDTQGNIALQGSLTGGVTIGTPSMSSTAYQSITNAPHIDNLQGFGCQLGGTAGALVYGVPVAAGGDINLIPDDMNNKMYLGTTSNLGFGTPGAEFHVEWGKTGICDVGRFNFFESAEQIYSTINEQI